MRVWSRCASLWPCPEIPILTTSNQVTVFLTTMDNFAEMNGVYEKYFAATKPARSCVAVKELPKGVPVEIEAVALSG